MVQSHNLQKIDQEAVDKQIDQVKKLKSERDNLSVNNKIEGIIVGKAIYDGEIKLEELAKEIDA